MDALFYLTNSVAVLTILFAWYKIYSLRRRVPGGLVKLVCNILSEFIGLFTLGFMALSLFPLLPEVSREIMVSLVFMGAAAFSIVIINYFSTIASESGF